MATWRAKIRGSQELIDELRRVFPDRPLEGMVVVGYGTDGRICGMAVTPEHRALSWVKVWELVGLADGLAAHSIVVFVFPTGRAPAPSAHELAVFGDLQVRARRAGLSLRDCYVLRGARLWSLRDLVEQQISA
jgi:hypothetical protein